MRNIRAALAGLILALAGPVMPARGYEIEASAHFGPPDAARRLAVLSTTDIDFLRPVIEGWLARTPGIGLDYTLASSQEVYRAIAEEGAVFDVVISSAMDLQMKLANDGFARPLPAEMLRTRPDWSRWRNLLVAVAQEPVTMILSDHALDGGLPMPHTRRDLIALLRDHPDRFRGRVGTYDPEVSGAGYLFAAQEARLSDTFWRLAEVMGRLDARLFCCSGDMIAAVRQGDLLIAYNVLGSYAAADGRTAPGFVVVEPEDFTLTLLRTALVPRGAADPTTAEAFVAFLLSPGGQQLISAAAGLPAIDAGAFALKPYLRPIRLDPGLLAPLDRISRQGFLAEWRAAMDQP
ncbi:MAG: ABC transporter substrate-binding protein [Defluviimonas sp.]|uniref:ABC transporter substrate-binding protein n=1 Tax=Albidovulum sp. TaxID=1872424 RepID=UPI001D294ACE|nr:ABC transporter substrate-binding protein [Paracoccaceae bacterium]MCC0063852.1 ABC transporter substrate-binding protein [Defluviimonas sp.]